MQNGTLIVIDGGDGAGKKTQTNLLVARLKKEGHQVNTLDFPQYENNTFGQLIRECLDGQRGDFLSLDARIASTLYAADRFESKEKIEGWLAAGHVVVLDRYVSSNMLHQGGKIDDPKQREEFLTWLDHMEHTIFGIPRPDLIVYCSVDPEKRLELLQTEAATTAVATDVAEEDLEHQRRTDAAAKQVAELNHWKTISCMSETTLRSPEDISVEIYKLVKDVI